MYEDTFGREFITCPYCGHMDRDSWEWNDGQEGDGETECGECEREFHVSRNVRVTYATRVRTLLP